MGPRFAEEIELVGTLIRVVAVYLGIAANMAATCCLERQEASAKRAFIGRAIGPKSPAGAPNLS